MSMPKVQDILVLFQTSPALDVAPAAWGRYEASKGTGIKDLIEESSPPYKNAMEAMRDGWQVIQMSYHKHRSEVDDELGPCHNRRYHLVLARCNWKRKKVSLWNILFHRRIWRGLLPLDT